MKDAEELAKLGVSAVDVVEYEASFGDKVDRELYAQERELEWKRLTKTRDSIATLQARIDAAASSRMPIARLSKLMDRLDELFEEERLILERIDLHSHNSVVTKIKRDNDEATKEEAMEEEKKSASKRLRLDKPITEDVVMDDLDKQEIFYDDGDPLYFNSRIKQWLNGLKDDSMMKNIPILEKPMTEQLDELNFPDLCVAGIKEEFKIPCLVWERLLAYQRDGVNWMLDLYRQEVGGIVGDEMGLGKTIQVIAFLASLQASQKLMFPALIICPATVMKQWVKEIHSWWPMLRVTLLHSAGSLGNDLKKALKVACNVGHVIVTSYGHLQHEVIGKKIISKEFSVVILDEGHKIRNPNAEVSLLCKQLQSPRRFILSGTPIQNNLIELWSLVDFIYPGRLGTLNVFKNEIALPINAGGYVNASSLQVQTSYRCACILKDLIAPYLLRRVKTEVAQNLPAKQEHVLFCQLTEYQKQLYQHYIDSEDVRAILSGEKNILAGIDILRKICNHPALLKLEDEKLYGFSHIVAPTNAEDKSGKMNVLGNILNYWKEHNHRVLLFCQTRQMLDIIEYFVLNEGYRYLRMDGTTAVNNRMTIVDRYNIDQSIFLFLLTTKVGGLGINLTGADRVLIYDPDWNPSTDMQARERAWRLGQTRPVTIYRMLTVGTIEEKIYHRQIFKQHLTNRILADPKQTRFFKSSDLYDLFTLSHHSHPDQSDTKALLSGLEPESIEQDKNHILDGLMQITGLHSALEHDKLIEKPKKEVLLVEREARKRAAEAIDAIQRSREALSFQRDPIMNGLTAGLSSSAILASIRRRQLVSGDDNKPMMSLPPSQEPLQRIVDQLLDLFSRNHGHCPSDIIVNTFSYINGEDAVAFRQILRTLATLDDHGGWKLKEEYHSHLIS